MKLWIKNLFENIQKLRSIKIISTVFLNIVFDQVSKFLVRNKINDGEIINVIKDNLVFIKVENSGAALGLGGSLPSNLKTIYFQILPIVVLLYFLKTIITNIEISKLTVLGLALAIGGAFGNIIDRIAYGSVTDFIQINIGILKTGIFNVGDISIVIGVLLVLFELCFNKNNNLVDSL